MPSIEERIDQAEAEEAFNRAFEEEIGFVEWRTNQDEGRQHGRSEYRDSTATQKAGIRNLDQAIAAALGRVDDKRIRSEWASDIDSRFPVDPQDDPRYLRYVEEMQADVLNNFLYDLYLEQLFDEGAEAISPSYPTFSLVIALKAALTLVATRPGLCEDLGITDRQFRDDAVTYLDQLTRGLHPYRDAPEFIASIMYEVPALFGVAERILAAYETAVTAERRAARSRGEWTDDTPLPSDADFEADRRVEREMLLERALVMVSTSSEPLKSIAKTYGVGHVQLSAEAKRRGINRPHGRPKGGGL